MASMATTTTGSSTSTSASGPTTSAGKGGNPTTTAAGKGSPAPSAGASGGGGRPAAGAPPAGAAAPAGGDATYAGSVATHQFGPVQVQITVSGHRLKEVTALQRPDGVKTGVASNDAMSHGINEDAFPKLIAQAIAAQNANIAGVSGATLTSGKFRESLESALGQARKAGTFHG
jgi:uncharacterized protein with FMN-binding domain